MCACMLHVHVSCRRVHVLCNHEARSSDVAVYVSARSDHTRWGQPVLSIPRRASRVRVSHLDRHESRLSRDAQLAPTVRVGANPHPARHDCWLCRDVLHALKLQVRAGPERLLALARVDTTSGSVETVLLLLRSSPPEPMRVHRNTLATRRLTRPAFPVSSVRRTSCAALTPVLMPLPLASPLRLDVLVPAAVSGSAETFLIIMLIPPTRVHRNTIATRLLTRPTRPISSALCSSCAADSLISTLLLASPLQLDSLLLRLLLRLDSELLLREAYRSACRSAASFCILLIMSWMTESVWLAPACGCHEIVMMFGRASRSTACRSSTSFLQRRASILRSFSSSRGACRCSSSGRFCSVAAATP
mmetsp:Transcript_9732/g.16686  ORF Transcript_9732/g.16686 Transcript_9732/m.16686 type:complete len:361 (-) Transcript_9732:37-1119(-)